MKLVVVHYHLNRGGVSQVIVNHLRALDHVLREPTEVLVLSGPRSLGWPEQLERQLGSVRLVRRQLPGLDYQELTTPEQRRCLGHEVEDLLRELGFRPGQTVVHVHNHSLGKNEALPAAVLHLARRGYHLLLHIHDFAEDYRPENYARVLQAVAPLHSPSGTGAAWAYPQAAHVHYAVLNDRDWGILTTSGIGTDRVHLLPNPVLASVELAARDEAREELRRHFGIGFREPFALYPVRGIRRKNLGEMLLWALMAPPGGHVGLTLAPLNPVEKPRYQFWRRVAAELSLPVVFECGEQGGLSFAQNLAACDALLNTSVAEGFGMVFLESALFGRELWGRDLPEVTQSFAQAGIRWPRLASQVPVHAQWFDHSRWQQYLVATYRRTLAQYGLAPEEVFPQWQEQLRRKLSPEGWCDFADLDHESQAEVLAQLAQEPVRRQEFLERNPLFDWDQGLRAPTHCAENAEVVRTRYSLEPSGRRLLDIYHRLLSTCPGQVEPHEGAERLLKEFLSPERFRIIRI